MTVVSFANSVTIGPEFFKKSLRDYSDAFWAFAREIMQNSLDCGSTAIKVRIREDTEAVTTAVIVENDGEPMSREILVGKLLALGGSGKDFKAGAVGGFGKAKELLYFAHRNYTIESGNLLLMGSGAGYDLLLSHHHVAGTRSVVIWEGLIADALTRQFSRFMRMVDRKVHCYLEGELIEFRLKGARFRRTLTRDDVEWADVKTGGNEPNLIVVRIGGTPMFTMSADFKKTIVVDLRGTSVERLTSNRDGLKWKYADQLTKFITELSVDRRSALRDQEPTYHRHQGYTLRIKQVEEMTKALQAQTVAEAANDRDFPPTNGNSGGAGVRELVQGRHDRPASCLGMQFIVKNCTKKPVPAEYDPASVDFSDYAHWIVRSWAGCLLELYSIFEVNRPFSVGFILSPELYGESENGDYGQVYYVNPIVIGPRSYRRRFTKSRKHELLAAVAHEFVHGALERHYHNEDYAASLTDVMGKVLLHWRKFAWLLK